MKVVQAVLKSGTTTRVCWVEAKIVVGNQITLRNSEDPMRLWTVESIGLMQDSKDIKSDWNVGGVVSRR